eukprot:737372-Prymnesium_polylepis.1
MAPGGLWCPEFGSGDDARRAMAPRVWFGRWRPEGYGVQTLVRAMTPGGRWRPELGSGDDARRAMMP